MKQILIILIALALMSAKCSRDGKSKVNPGFYAEGYVIPYLVNSPDTIFSLKRELTEISGLTYSDQTNMLLAINDEKAYVYQVNPNSGKIIDKIDFGKSDDYEGIAYVNGKIYIAESNGNVKVVSENGSEKINEFDDILSEDHDIEGLCYNSLSSSILMAAKGDSRVKGNEKSEKSVFSMEIVSGKITDEPYLSINLLKAIKTLKSDYITKNALVDLSVTSRLKDFGPSGIAVHPTTNDLYILSAKGKLLVVINQEKEVKAVVFLKQSLHVQPEGITFDPEGNLYISNEGRSRKGKIFKYKAQLETEKKKKPLLEVLSQ
jgi:uncharacterized protein YjiK